MCDIFCIIFITSSQQHKHNTAAHSDTHTNKTEYLERKKTREVKINVCKWFKLAEISAVSSSFLYKFLNILLLAFFYYVARLSFALFQFFFSCFFVLLWCCWWWWMWCWYFYTVLLYSFGVLALPILTVFCVRFCYYCWLWI